MSNLIPGEIIHELGEIELNLSKQVKTVTVSNSFSCFSLAILVFFILQV